MVQEDVEVSWRPEHPTWIVVENIHPKKQVFFFGGSFGDLVFLEVFFFLSFGRFGFLQVVEVLV